MLTTTTSTTTTTTIFSMDDINIFINEFSDIITSTKSNDYILIGDMNFHYDTDVHSFNFECLFTNHNFYFYNPYQLYLYLLYYCNFIFYLCF